jgi:hypothetical protein
MKKLLAMLTVGGVLALTTGCPPAPTTENKAPIKPMTSDTHKPEATKPEATKPEATKPEATKPEATKPEATKPEATKPEATKPEATKPEATKPSAGEKTEMGKVEKGKLMVGGKEVDVSGSVKDDLKNIKDGSDVTVTMDKDGKVTKVEEKK